MKFSTLITSFIACGSIAATPVVKLPPNFDIHKYVNAEQAYNQLQFFAKIPKEDFIKQVNEGLNKVEKALELGLDLGKRLDNLDDKQKIDLKSYWNYLSRFYPSVAPFESPEQLINFASFDAMVFIQIIYKENPKKVIEGFMKHLNN